MADGVAGLHAPAGSTATTTRPTGRPADRRGFVLAVTAVGAFRPALAGGPAVAQDRGGAHRG